MGAQVDYGETSWTGPADPIVRLGDAGDYLVIGCDGWCYLACERLRSKNVTGWVHVQWVSEPDDLDEGRFGVTQLALVGARGITPDMLAAVPIRDIEAAFNDGDTWENVSRLADTQDLGWRDGEDGNDIADDGAANPYRLRPFLMRLMPQWEAPDPLPHPDAEPHLVLTIPDSTPYPDDFYRDVARARADLAARFRNPDKRLAEINGQSETTVARWVRVARQKQFLPPSTRRRART